MSGKSVFYSFGLLFALSTLIVIFQQSTIRFLKQEIQWKEREEKTWEEILKREMTLPLGDRPIHLADSLASVSKTGTIVLVPDTICHACFQSLTQRLRELSIPPGQITFYLPESQSVLKRILQAQGYDNCVIVNRSPEELNEILVSRIASNGWQRCYFRYAEKQDSALSQFFNL